MRHLSAIPLALLATFGLAWLMKTLIETRSIEDEFVQPPARIVYVSNDLEEVDAPLPPNPDQPQLPEETEPEPPQPMPEPEKKSDTPKAVPIKKPQPKHKPKKRVVAKRTARAKFSTTPLYRRKPSYPARARRQGIEGYVTVRYTITQSGTVRNVGIVSASPPGIFNAAALNAVRSWRYRPQPADRLNVKTRIRFVLRGRR